MRVKRYDRDIKDDNGSKELVDLRNRNTFLLYDNCIYVSLVFLLAEVRGKVFVRITVHLTRPQGITSTIAIAIGLCVVYKGGKNKSVV